MLRTFLLITLFLALFCSRSHAITATSPAELRAIKECLSSYGGLTPENAQRLQRYKQWSDTYEEIPCFTNCYLNKMFNFYNESIGFNEEHIIAYFGQSVYEECKHRLRSYGRSHCELAYNGLHCLVNLENDPFIMIESMNKLNVESKTTMKGCLRKFNQHEWPLLHEYAKFPVREPIPCYTKCFLDKLEIYDYRRRQWNIVDMRYKLGIPEEGVNYSHCQAMSRRRNRNSCAWIYNEFTCYALAK